MCTATQVLLKALMLGTKASRWPVLFPLHVTDQHQHVSLSVQLPVYNTIQYPDDASKACFDHSLSFVQFKHSKLPWQANYELRLADNSMPLIM